MLNVSLLFNPPVRLTQYRPVSLPQFARASDFLFFPKLLMFPVPTLRHLLKQVVCYLLSTAFTLLKRLGASNEQILYCIHCANTSKNQRSQWQADQSAKMALDCMPSPLIPEATHCVQPDCLNILHWISLNLTPSSAEDLFQFPQEY